MTETAPGLHDLVASVTPTNEDSDRSRSGGIADRVRRPTRALRRVPYIGTYAGLFIIAIGAVLLTIAWGRTAGLTNVGLQVPYVISAGFTGVAAVVVGLTIIRITADRADFAERTRQAEMLRDLLAELRHVIEEEAQ